MLFSFIAFMSIAQELHWEFINAGGSVEGDSARLHWTIGESLTTEVNGETASLRMGFLPFSKIEDELSSVKYLNDNIEILISPNPVSDYLNVHVNNVGVYELKLIAQNGAELFTTKFRGSYSYDVSSYAAGAMTVIITDEAGTFNSTKFIKI